MFKVGDIVTVTQDPEVRGDGRLSTSWAMLDKIGTFIIYSVYENNCGVKSLDGSYKSGSGEFFQKRFVLKQSITIPNYAGELSAFKTMARRS